MRSEIVKISLRIFCVLIRVVQNMKKTETTGAEAQNGVK